MLLDVIFAFLEEYCLLLLGFSQCSQKNELVLLYKQLGLLPFEVLLPHLLPNSNKRT